MKIKGLGAMTCEAYNALGHFRVQIDYKQFAEFAN
jgi:hypothetical protein